MNLTKRKENLVTEQIYRSLKEKISYSVVKSYLSNRQRFYKEFILKEPVEEKESFALTMGQLIDTLITDRDNFDMKFAIGGTTEPTGQLKTFADNLYRRTKKALNEEGQINCTMALLLEQAYNDTKYDYEGKEIAFKGKDFAKVVELFSGSEAEIYYKDLRNNTGKTVVSVRNIEQAEAVANDLKTSSITSDIINAETSEHQSVFYQLAVFFTHNGLECKSLIDKLVVNHITKEILPYDIKTSYDNENFDYSYTKYMYFLQASMYDLALSYWVHENNLEDYVIKPMAFVVADSVGYMRPLVYQLTEQDLVKAYEGFSIRGKKYPGLIYGLEQMLWHIETGIWNCSKEAYLNNGKQALELQYDN